jgi:DNA-binding MarR family transcriptional regulator
MYDYQCAKQPSHLMQTERIKRNADMDSLDMAGHLIRRLHQQSTTLFVQRTQAAGFDLTPVQFAALDAIHTHPATDQAFVAELIGYDRATIGGVIDRLEKKGWIRRVISERDRRARELSLTAKGKRVLSSLQPVVKDLQQGILQPLSDADRERFIELARQLVWQRGATDAS